MNRKIIAYACALFCATTVVHVQAAQEGNPYSSAQLVEKCCPSSRCCVNGCVCCVMCVLYPSKAANECVNATLNYGTSFIQCKNGFIQYCRGLIEGDHKDPYSDSK